MRTAGWGDCGCPIISAQVAEKQRHRSGSSVALMPAPRAGHGSWKVAVAAISLRDILIIVGLVSIGFLLRAGRWHYYTHVLNWDVPLLHSLTAFVASIALTATPLNLANWSKRCYCAANIKYRWRRAQASC